LHRSIKYFPLSRKASNGIFESPLVAIKLQFFISFAWLNLPNRKSLRISLLSVIFSSLTIEL